MMIDEHHATLTNHTGHDQHLNAAHLLPTSASADGQPALHRLAPATGNSVGTLQQPFSPPPPHPTPHPALLAAVPSSAPSSASPSSLSSRVNSFRSACLDCLISHQTHHLIPHSSKVVIFDSKLKVSHAFDGLVTHDINCFPESDTRLLTNRGFAFLSDIEARLKVGEAVLYGCYDVASKRLVYRSGEVVFDKRVHKQLVWFASPDETRRWSDDSDEYGGDSYTADGEEDEQNISLRVTAQHRIYSQRGHLNQNSASVYSWDVGPPNVRPAESLLSPCSCPPHLLDCSHRTSATRLVALAEAGFAPSQQQTDTADRRNEDERWKQLSATQPVVKTLQLSSVEQWTAFLGLLGFWLSDGSLQCDEAGQRHSLQFGRREASDRTWLANQLHTAGVADEHIQSLPRCSNNIDSFRVTEPRWLDWFNEQFGAQITPSTSPAREFHHDTTAFSNLPLSPTTSALSPPASPSASRLSCYSDDCPDSHCPSPHHTQSLDQMDTVDQHEHVLDSSRLSATKHTRSDVTAASF